MEGTKLMEQTVKTLVPQFGQILIGDERSRSLSSVYFANPSPLEERNFGHLFMVLDIQNSEHDDNKKILSFLEQEIRHGYYYSEHFSVEEAFEQALQETNQKIQSMSPGASESWIRQMNILVGVLKGQTLTLSHSGTIHAFLVQNDRIIDIIEQKSGSGIQPPARLFGNMVTGEISPKNSLLFCTPSFLDYFSLEKIKKTIETTSVEQSTDHIVQLLSDNENQDSFAAILLRLKNVGSIEPNTAPLPAHAQIEKLNQEIAHRAEIDSMHELVHKEQATSELLTPSLWPVVKKNLKNIAESSQQFIRQRLFQGSNPLRPRSIEPPADHFDPLVTPSLRPNADHRPRVNPASPSKQILTTFGKILKILRWLGIKLLTMVVYAGRLIMQIVSGQGRKQVKNKFQHFPQRATTSFSRLLLRLKGMSRPRQILLALSLLFIFLFAQSIINLGERNEAAGQKAEWEANLEKVRVNLVEAEAAMNYDNSEGALTFLSSASDLLAAIPIEAEALDEQKQQLSQQVRQLQGKINKISIIDQPVLFSDLTQIHPDLRVSHLFLSGTSLIGFDANNGSTYAIDETPETLLDQSSPAAAIRSITGDAQGRVLLLRSDGSVTRIEGSKASLMSISFANQDRNLVSLAAFSPNRLYSLDQKNKQIFKHTATADGFGAGEAWLKDDSVQLDDSLGMAVDGSIYVLKTSGEVVKLFGGQKQAFSLDSLEPALTAATKIFTSETTAGIYLLDPNNKRIAVFDKQGKITGQYVSEAFDNLLDFAVVENQNVLYVLNGQKVFRIDLHPAGSAP